MHVEIIVLDVFSGLTSNPEQDVLVRPAVEAPLDLDGCARRDRARKDPRASHADENMGVEKNAVAAIGRQLDADGRGEARVVARPERVIHFRQQIAGQIGV